MCGRRPTCISSYLCKYTYVSKSPTKALYPAYAYSGASLENGSVGPQRARTLVSPASYVRFDERRRQTLWTEILRIPGYHEYAPTTTVLAFVVSKLYPEKVPRHYAEISHRVSTVYMLFFTFMYVLRKMLLLDASCTAFFLSKLYYFLYRKTDTIFVHTFCFIFSHE